MSGGSDRRARARARRARSAAVLTLALSALSMACGGTGRGARRRIVVIHQLRYTPDPLVAAAGDTVEWRNQDLVPHTATAVDHAWDTGGIDPDGHAAVVVVARGTHAYGCAFHPTMAGHLEVR